MTKTIDTDLCVIGAGSGGLTVAAGASQMGARTVLIEKGRMGGDCLNYGCVPSKSLIASAHAAEAPRLWPALGLRGPSPDIDFLAVKNGVQDVIDAIAPHDSQARFEGLGVQVVRAAAEFIGEDAVRAGDTVVRARRFVIATGSRPFIPAIDGLGDVDYLTNETLFTDRTPPAHLLVIGGGPVGMEMAQAHARLGARVTVFARGRALAREDRDLAEIAIAALRDEDVDIVEGARVIRAARTEADGVALTYCLDDDRTQTVEGSHLLVAAGRAANVEGLNLEAAGVVCDAKGVEVDRRLRTSNRRIYAIGDVTGRQMFTHMAAHHAGIVLRNALFRWPAKAVRDAVPRVTFTDPELAYVGLGEDEARARHGRIRLLRWPFSENDRARTERATTGFVKVVTTPRGRILGAGIVGRNAGDLLQPWELAIRRKLKIGALADLIVPYPTRSEANKRAAGGFYADKLFSPRTRKLVRLLLRLG